MILLLLSLLLTALAGLATLAILDRGSPELQGPAPPRLTNERLLTAEELARFLGLPRDRIRQWANVGVLPPVRIERSTPLGTKKAC